MKSFQGAVKIKEGEDGPILRECLAILALFVLVSGAVASPQPQIGNLEDWYPPSVSTIELDIGDPILIDAGDFNEDGNIDLIIAADMVSNGHYQYKIFLLLGQGEGKFGEPLLVAQGPVLDNGGRVGFGSGVITDLDGDRHLDFISFLGSIGPMASNPLTTIVNKLLILWGNGDGTFEDQWLDLPSVVFPMLQPASSIAIGDFDGDEKLDIAYPCFDPVTIVILYNKGHRILKEPESITISEKGGYCVAVPFNLLAADLNHDGKEDLIVGGSCVFDEKGSGQKQYKRFIKVLLSKGKGSFQQSTVYISAVPDFDAFAPALWAGDLDMDGNVDLIFTEPFKTQTLEEIFSKLRWVELVKMLKGKGDGMFLEQPTFSSFVWPIASFLDIRTKVSGELTFISIFLNREIRITQGVPPGLNGPTLLEDVTDALVTDIDSDGWAEIVTITPNRYKKTTKVIILEGKTK